MTSSVRKDPVRRISSRVHGSICRLNRVFATTPETPQRVAAPMTAACPRSRLRISLLQGRIQGRVASRSEEHTSELQSQSNLVCRLLLEKKKKYNHSTHICSA